MGVPTGGASGQVLKKASSTDYDTVWADESGGGGGLDYQGDWVAGTYTEGQVVRFKGKNYLCVATSTTAAPVDFSMTLVNQLDTAPVSTWWTQNAAFKCGDYVRVNTANDDGAGAIIGPLLKGVGVTDFSITYRLSPVKDPAYASSNVGSVVAGVAMDKLKYYNGASYNPTSYGVDDYAYGHDNNYIGMLFRLLS